MMTISLWTFALSVFTGFFAIMNPIANTPVFMGLTDGRSEDAKKRIAWKACITTFIIVAVFVFLGKYIFELFGITIPAFKIAGGVLLFYVGFEMLQSKKSTIHNPKDMDIDEGIAISPLAIPILAGPGTIVTAMNYTANSTYVHIAIIVGVFAFLIFLTYLFFAFSNKIVKLFGSNLITVIGKIMGLIITIIGTGMVIDGIKIAFKL
ncbi:MAG TPA: MarC family protein [Bacteroidales bacterium]